MATLPHRSRGWARGARNEWSRTRAKGRHRSARAGRLAHCVAGARTAGWRAGARGWGEAGSAAAAGGAQSGPGRVGGAPRAPPPAGAGRDSSRARHRPLRDGNGAVKASRQRRRTAVELTRALESALPAQQAEISAYRADSTCAPADAPAARRKLKFQAKQSIFYRNDGRARGQLR